jgi:hypothetical protein
VSAEESERTRLNYLSPVYKIDEAEHRKLIEEADQVGVRNKKKGLSGGGGVVCGWQDSRRLFLCRFDLRLLVVQWCCEGRLCSVMQIHRHGLTQPYVWFCTESVGGLLCCAVPCRTVPPVG